MADPLHCYRCGESLSALSLPLARLDECPSCRTQLHVCRMCTHYAPRLKKNCDEEDAPDVRDARAANFCDYFTPDPAVQVGGDLSAEAAALSRLDALFGAGDAQDDGPASPDRAEPEHAGSGDPDDAARRAAEALFRK